MRLLRDLKHEFMIGLVRVRDFDGLMLERAISHDSRYEAAHEELRNAATDCASEYV